VLIVLLIEKLGVDRDELCHLRGHIFQSEDRFDRTLRFAGGAFDALIRMDVVHVFAFVYAIHWTDFHATGILEADARLGDDVCH
jgi:hypothetical protein